MRVDSRWLTQLAMRDQAVDLHFELGLAAYGAGNLMSLGRHRAAVGLLPEAGVDSLYFLALRWRELWLESAGEDALEVAQRAHELAPLDLETARDLGALLAEMGLDEASLEVCMDCVRTHANDADLWYEIGILAEGLNNGDLWEQAFRRVWELDLEVDDQGKFWVSEERLAASVELAAQVLSSPAADLLRGMEVVFEEYPGEWILDTLEADPRICVAVQIFGGVTEEVGRRLVFFKDNIRRFLLEDDELEDRMKLDVIDAVEMLIAQS